tara:strand:- start:648 stop:920 length:273 start_codon:yes stop_codon:yes gene_type:complete
MIELVQIKKTDTRFELSTVFVNPQHILFLTEDNTYKGYLREGKINLGLNQQTTFTKLKMLEGTSSRELTIVGDPKVIQLKMTNKKQLLRD